MEDAASHVSTGVGVVVSGSVAFEDGELGAAMAEGFLGEVGSGQTGRRRRRRRWGRRKRGRGGGFLINYFRGK